MADEAVVDQMAYAELHEHHTYKEADEEPREVGIGVARELYEVVDWECIVPGHIFVKGRGGLVRSLG